MMHMEGNWQGVVKRSVEITEAILKRYRGPVNPRATICHIFQMESNSQRMKLAQGKPGRARGKQKHTLDDIVRIPRPS